MGQTPCFIGDQRSRNVSVDAKERRWFPLGLLRGEPGTWVRNARYHVEAVNKKGFRGEGIRKAGISLLHGFV